MFKTSPKQQAIAATRRNPKILFYDDERSIGNAIIVTLRYGWRFDTSSSIEHTQGFDTKREANSAVRDAVPCNCSDCSARKIA